MMKAATKSILTSLFAVLLCGCSASTLYRGGGHDVAPARLDRALNFVLSSPTGGVDALKGAVLIRDGGPVAQPELAIARAILRTNPRIAQAEAMLLADVTTRAARSQSLPPEFLAATILQESAYDASAISAAGAIGIAQFMPETAQSAGVDPYDPLDAIDGAASLLGGYVSVYRLRYTDAYATALAAYNAGPVAVAAYRGVPPYAETRQYIALIYDRWARIVSFENDKTAGRQNS